MSPELQFELAARRHPEPHHAERRAGVRRRVPDDIAAFLVRPSRSVLRRAPIRVEILLDNMSVGGMGFYAPASENLHHGDVVTLEVEGRTSAVRLSRVRDMLGNPWVYCGAAFTESAPAIVGAFSQLFNDDGAPSGKVLRWEHAQI